VHPPAVIGSCQCRTGRVELVMTRNGIQMEQTREEPMSDLQAIANRFEIEALRGGLVVFTVASLLCGLVRERSARTTSCTPVSARVTKTRRSCGVKISSVAVRH
jgi:hypothetical protein